MLQHHTGLLLSHMTMNCSSGFKYQQIQIVPQPNFLVSFLLIFQRNLHAQNDNNQLIGTLLSVPFLYFVTQQFSHQRITSRDLIIFVHGDLRHGFMPFWLILNGQLFLRFGVSEKMPDAKAS